jgi:DeoR family transcriptional regulator, catabolite repression regulator
MEDRTVLEAKRLGVLVCSENQNLTKAAQRMVEEDVSALAVVDVEGYLSGIITRTDLIRALLTTPQWENLPVGKFMVADVVTVPPTASLMDVSRLMLEKQIHRIVVVREENGKKRPISVISAADIVYYMVK